MSTTRKPRRSRPRPPRPTLPVTARFDQVVAAGLTVTFHRTLRVPDNGHQHALPPSLGRFPVRNVTDLPGPVSDDMLAKGGVIVPMLTREAMWIAFSGPARAVKVAAGKTCAVTGLPWARRLRRHPQDYLVAPTQPWIDGFKTADGHVSQFVAVPLGSGDTVEGQVTGRERHGGLQIAVFEPKPGRVPTAPRTRVAPAGAETWNVPVWQDWLVGDAPPTLPLAAPSVMSGCSCTHLATTGPQLLASCSSVHDARAARGVKLRGAAAPLAAAPLGMAAGGSIEQRIHPDPYGPGAWDQSRCARLFVHLVSVDEWEQLTGERAPVSPVTRSAYRRYGYPWFARYDAHLGDVGAGQALQGVQTLAERDEQRRRSGRRSRPGAVSPGAW